MNLGPKSQRSLRTSHTDRADCSTPVGQTANAGPTHHVRLRIQTAARRRERLHFTIATADAYASIITTTDHLLCVYASPRSDGRRHIPAHAMVTKAMGGSRRECRDASFPLFHPASAAIFMERGAVSRPTSDLYYRAALAGFTA
ncbi:hypothetical protein KCP70_13880 [Salmonella enterica subsp. enterica]|nr:hypothetical protein KCP70_13880 [Salmonella enterica subsp. enterica]